MSGGGGKIWLDDLECTGEETALDDCGKHSGGWGAHNCGCVFRLFIMHACLFILGLGLEEGKARLVVRERTQY